MATYGTRDATQFELPSVESGEKYYTLVDSQTGQITLKRLTFGSFTESLDATVGTIDATGENKGKFVPGAGASPTERKAFAQQPQALKAVKDQAETTTNKAQQKLGIDPATSSARTKELLNNGKANTPPSGDSVDAEAASQEIASSRDNTRRSFLRTLKYPLNLENKFQDVIQFNMVEFRPRKLESGSDLNAVQDRPQPQKIIGTVTLPIPSGISDTNSVNWNSDELNPIGAAAASIANKFIGQGGGAAASEVENIAGAVQDNSSDVGLAFKSKFVEVASGTQNILARTSGAVINSNMELLFLGPQLRPFSFTFKLSARSKRESEAILTIIRFFKQGMSPIRTKSSLFLKAPHTFQLKYLHRDQPHKFLNEFKECALTAFSVEYTPEGQYATFENGAMVSYQIQMQFQELEPVFNDDYGLGNGANGYDTKIGY